MCRRQRSNLFADELRLTLEVVAVCLLPATDHPNAAVVFRPAPVWGTVLLDESLISRGPDALAGGYRYSVELIETRN